MQCISNHQPQVAGEWDTAACKYIDLYYLTKDTGTSKLNDIMPKLCFENTTWAIVTHLSLQILFYPNP